MSATYEVVYRTDGSEPTGNEHPVTLEAHTPAHAAEQAIAAHEWRACEFLVANSSKEAIVLVRRKVDHEQPVPWRRFVVRGEPRPHYVAEEEAR